MSSGPGQDRAPERDSFRDRLSATRHDLRTPVGHIIGYSEMLEEDLDPASEGQLVEDLREIRSGGERLVELIDDLLGPAKRSPDDIDLPLAGEQLLAELDGVDERCARVHELAERTNQGELLPDVDKIREAAHVFRSAIQQLVSTEALLARDPSTDPDAILESGSEDDPAPQAADRYEAAWLGEGGQILVVDDDPANRELLERRLRRQGYDIASVGDGESALEYLGSNHVDLVLLDMLMPGLSGTDVLRRLKDDKALRATPVIMLSALDDMNEVVQCVLLGAEDYVLKPFNPVLLKARIAACLEKHRLRAQQALTLRVFISSPGDVIPERRILRGVISQLNEELRGEAHLVPIFWEDEPLLASETFQAQIHSPRDADIYVGIFWSRMGSPLPDSIRRPDGSRYASGSEFEFEEAMEGYDASGAPEILVYRKTAEPIVRLTTREEVEGQLEQKERLEDFLSRWFTSDDGQSYTGAFHGFESGEQLEELVSSHLHKLVMKRLSPSV